MNTCKYEQHLKPNERVLFENESEKLYGKVVHFFKDDKCVELNEVYDEKTDYRYHNNIFLSLSNYKIRVLFDEKDDELEKNVTAPNSFAGPEKNPETSATETENETAADRQTHNFGHCLLNCRKKKTKKPKEIVCVLHPNELEKIDILLGNIIIIKKYGSEYKSVLQTFFWDDELSIVIAKDATKEKVKFISIASWAHVFVFDMESLKEIDANLKLILKKKRLRKIVLSNETAEILQEFYGATLRNVKEIKALNLSKKYKKMFDELSFTDTLTKILKLPAEYSFEEINTDKVQAKSVAQIAVFQLKLYDYLYHKVIAKEFYETCTKFAQSYVGANPADVALLRKKSQKALWSN